MDYRLFTVYLRTGSLRQRAGIVSDGKRPREQESDRAVKAF